MNIKSIIKNKMTFYSHFLLISLLDIVDRHYSKTDPIESLFIHGFWRSGTTYLQELVSYVFKARTIVEPWNEACPETKRLMDRINLNKDPIYRKLYMPEYNVDEFENWMISLERGTLSGEWIRSTSTWSMLNSQYRSRIVTKFVRGAFLVPQFTSQYKYPWIFLKRDLHSNIDSFKRTKWTYWFDKIDLEVLLLDQAHGNYFVSFKEFISKWNKQGFIAKVAAYKLLTDYYVEQNIVEANGLIVKYDELVNNPMIVIEQIRKITGWEIKNLDWINKTQKASKFTASTSIGQTGGFRKAKNSLTDKEKDLLDEIEYEFLSILEQKN